MKIGIMLPQEWVTNEIDPIGGYEIMTRVAQEAEILGFDSVWLFDHVLSTNSTQRTERMHFECWTSTAALARDTKRIRIGQLATCNSFRSPTLLAKMASTVDVLSHGRLLFGIGAGWYEQEYLAYGYPYPDAATRLRQLREALQIIKAMWTEEEVSFTGKYYQIHGAINQPKGVQKPHIPILVAGKGEQVTLKLVARYADACNLTHPSPAEMKHKFGLLQQYCQEIGRDDREIQRTIYVNCCISETDADAEAKATHIPSKFTLDEMRRRGLIGSPATIRQRLYELEQQGVQGIILTIPDITNREALHLLAQCLKKQ